MKISGFIILIGIGLFILATTIGSQLIGYTSLLVIFMGFCHLSFKTWEMFLTMPKALMNSYNIESISYIDFEESLVNQQIYFSCLQTDLC
jgi:hypothetical protein